MNAAGDVPVLAVVVPCYNEEKVLPQTAARLLAVMEKTVASGAIQPASFLYFVDDGSRDQTWPLIERLHRGDARVKGLKLSRNFGHQNALLAGLLGVRERCDCVITIDADLQHDENLIPQFVEKHRQGADLVFGIRNDRKSDGFLKKTTALFFYHLMRLMGANIVRNHADYRLVSRRALEVLATYREVNLFLRGIFTTIGFRVDYLSFDVKERMAGSTKYSLRRMLSLALSGITAFSNVPLRVVTFFGFIIFLMSLIMAAYVLYVVLIQQNAVPGWASTVLPIYFLGGVQLLGIGLLGEYIGRIYTEVKDRPRFIKERELT